MTKERDLPVEPTKRGEAEALPDGQGGRADSPQVTPAFKEQYKQDQAVRAKEDERHNVKQTDLPKVKLVDASKPEDLIPVEGLNGETVAVKALVTDVHPHTQREPWSAEALAGIASDSALAISMGAVEKISKDMRAIFEFVSQTPELIEDGLDRLLLSAKNSDNPVNVIAKLPKCREALEAYVCAPNDQNRKELTRTISQTFKWGEVGEAALNTMFDPDEAKHITDAVVRTVQSHIEALNQFCIEGAKTAGKTLDEKPLTFAGINLALDSACLKYALKPSEETAATLSKELTKSFLSQASAHDRELAQEYFNTVLAPNKELQMQHAEALLHKAGYAETRDALVDYEKDPSELNRFRLIQSLRPNAGSAAGDLIENVIVMVAPESAGVLGSRLLGATARGGAEVAKVVGAEVKAAEAISTDAVAAESQTIKLKPDDGQKLEIPKPQLQEAKTSARKANQPEWADADPSTRDDIRLTSKFKDSAREEKLLKALEGSKNRKGEYTFERSVEPLAELSDFYTKHGFYSKAQQVQMVAKELQEVAIESGKVEGVRLIPQPEEKGLRGLINRALDKWDRSDALSRIADADRSWNEATFALTRSWSEVVQAYDQKSLNDMMNTWRRASVDCRRLGQPEKADMLERFADNLADEMEIQIKEGRKLLATQEKIIGDLHDDAKKYIKEARRADYSNCVKLYEKAINNLESAILKGDNSEKMAWELFRAADSLSHVHLGCSKNFEGYQTLLKCRSFLDKQNSQSLMNTMEKHLIDILERTPELQRGATAQEFELYEKYVAKLVADADDRIQQLYKGTSESWTGHPTAFENYQESVLPLQERERWKNINRRIKTLQSNNPKLLTQVLEHLGYRLDGERLVRIGA